MSGFKSLDWTHGPYPKGKSFAEMLDWHLRFWGTRPGCNLKQRNKIHSVVSVATEFHDGYPPRSDGNPERKLLQWRRGQNPPTDELIICNIFGYLFGDDKRLTEWKCDLEEALKDARSKPDRIGLDEKPDIISEPAPPSTNAFHSSNINISSGRSLGSPQHGRFEAPSDANQLRAKLDFLKYNISQQRLAALGEAPERWRERFEPIAMAEVMGYEVRTVSAASIFALVDQKVSGKRPLKFPERLKLAEHLALAMPDRDRATAAALLADETPLDHFSAELVRAGWATASQVGHNRLRSRQLLFEAFKPFGLRAGGLIVGDDTTIHAAKLGETRGMDIPQLEDIANLQSIAEGSQVGLVVENLAAPRGLLLLEIGPMHDDGLHPITSLVPSILAPQCAVLPDQILPTTPVLGVSRFIARKPVGRYDWLAILTLTPLSPVWPQGEGYLHRLSENEVDWLIETLEEQLRFPEGARVLEVRHHAFRIHEISA